MDAQIINDHLEQSMRQLTQLQAVIQQGASALEQFKPKLEECLDSLKAQTATGQEWTELFAAIDQDAGESHSEAFVDVCASYAETIGELSNRLSIACDQLASEGQSAEETAQSLAQSIETLSGTVNEVWTEVESTLQSHSEKFATGGTTWEEPSKELLQQLDDWTSKSSARDAELVGLFDSIESACENDWPTQLSEACNGILTFVDESVNSELSGRLESFTQAMRTLHEDFDSESQSLSAEILDRIQGLFDSLQEYAVEATQSKIGEAIEQLIRDILANFAAEIAQTILMTNVGVATTSSLSTMLPYLIATKKTLELINDMMDTFSF